MKSGVYKILNTENGNFYIGSSKDLDKRWIIHKSRLKIGKHINCILQRSWNKYGEKIFVFDIVELCDKDKLFEREQFYIDNLKPKYNIALKADGGDNLTNNPNRDDIIKRITRGLYMRYENMSDEEKIKRSENLKGCKNPNYGNTWSDKSKEEASIKKIEYFKNNSPINKGKKLSDLYDDDKVKEIKEKISTFASSRTGEKNAFFGKHHTEEYKEKAMKRRKDKYFGEQNIPFIIDGVEYDSLGKASKELDIPLTTIRWRIKSKNKKFDNYYYK